MLAVYLLASLLILLIMLRFTHETSQAIQNHSTALLSYFAKIVLYIFSLLFTFVYVADCQCIALWQWQCGILAVFLSWINLLIAVAKFPLTGIYVLMLIRVFYTFLKVFLLSSLFVIAFGISFYMAFREPTILVSYSYMKNNSSFPCVPVLICFSTSC